MGKALRFTALTLTVGVALYACLGYYGVPYAARSTLNRYAQKFERNLTVGDIRFNPWTWTLNIDNLVIDSLSGKGKFLELKALGFDIALRSLLESAPVINKFEINGLKIIATMGEDNLRQLIDAFRKEDEPRDGTLRLPQSSEKRPLNPRFSVYDIRVSNGSVRFVDKVHGVDEAFTDIRLRIPFLSTLADTKKTHGAPYVAFVFNGKPVEATGATRSSEGVFETEIDLRVNAFDCAPIGRILPMVYQETLRLESGLVSTDLKVLFRNPTENAPSQWVLSGDVSMSSVALSTEHGGQRVPFLGARRGTVRIAYLNPVKSELELSSIELEAPSAHIFRTSSGIPGITAAPAEDPWFPSGSGAGGFRKTSLWKKTEAPSWRWALGEVQVTDGRVMFLDERFGTPGAVTLTGISGSLSDLSSEVGMADFSLSADSLSGGLLASGSVSLKPFRLSASVSGNGLDLQGLSPYLRRASKGWDLQAMFDFDASVAFRDGSWLVGGSFQAADVSAALFGQPLLTAESAEMALNALDMGSKTLDVREVSLRNASLDLPGVRKIPSAGPAAGTKNSGRAPWRWSVAEVSVEDSSVRLRSADESHEQPAELTGIEARAGRLSSQAQSEAKVDVSGSLGSGTFHASSTLVLRPFPAGTLQLSSSKLPLRTLLELMNPEGRHVVKEGEASLVGTLSFSLPGSLVDSAQTLDWRGSVEMNDVAFSAGTGWKHALLTDVDLVQRDAPQAAVGKATILLAEAPPAPRGAKDKPRPGESAGERPAPPLEWKNIHFEDGAFHVQETGDDAQTLKLLLGMISEAVAGAGARP